MANQPLPWLRDPRLPEIPDLGSEERARLKKVAAFEILQRNLDAAAARERGIETPSNPGGD